MKGDSDEKDVGRILVPILVEVDFQLEDSAFPRRILEPPYCSFPLKEIIPYNISLDALLNYLNQHAIILQRPTNTLPILVLSLADIILAQGGAPHDSSKS